MGPNIHRSTVSLSLGRQRNRFDQEGGPISFFPTKVTLVRGWGDGVLGDPPPGFNYSKDVWSPDLHKGSDKSSSINAGGVPCSTPCVQCCGERGGGFHKGWLGTAGSGALVP